MKVFLLAVQNDTGEPYRTIEVLRNDSLEDRDAAADRLEEVQSHLRYIVLSNTYPHEKPTPHCILTEMDVLCATEGKFL